MFVDIYFVDVEDIGIVVNMFVVIYIYIEIVIFVDYYIFLIIMIDNLYFYQKIIFAFFDFDKYYFDYYFEYYLNNMDY